MGTLIRTVAAVNSNGRRKARTCQLVLHRSAILTEHIDIRWM